MPTNYESITNEGVENIVDNTGSVVAIESLPQVLAYDASDNLSTVTATDGVNTWVQTYTYTSGRLASISNWVRS